MLGGMDIQHVPIVEHNPEENGLVESFNLTVMNAVRTLSTAQKGWQYWIWALMDATGKYNQLPYRTIGVTPQQVWFQNNNLSLKNLFIFSQIGFVPFMDKKITKKKYNKRGRLVRSLRRDGLTNVMVETVDGEIGRYHGSDFHPYYTSRDPAKIF